MATNNTSSSNPQAKKIGDVLDALSSEIVKTAARTQARAPTPGSRGPGRTCPPVPDGNNARRSLGVFSRTPSALARARNT